MTTVLKAREIEAANENNEKVTRKKTKTFHMVEQERSVFAVFSSIFPLF